MDVDTYRRSVRIADTASQQTLNFSVIDAGPRDAARTLVFLHGFGGRAAYWEHQLAYFAQDSRVLALDLRGHGLSDAPYSQYTVEELCEDVIAILAAVQAPERFVLVGHSFGGALSSYFISRCPERVEKFIIIASAVRFKLRWAGRLLLSLPPWLLGLSRRFFALSKLYPPSHVVVRLNRNALSIWDGSPYLQQIKVPSLVILGQRDLLFSQESYREVAKQIPQAQEVIVPVSAHQVMVDRPEAVNRAMERFLGKASTAEQRSKRREQERQLEAERPWLKYFDPRTPYRIKPPVQAVQRMMEIAARRYHDTAAFIFHGQSTSYRRLDQEANRFAQSLLALGLQAGERVGLLLPNSPQAMVGYYGVLKARGVVVFLNPLFTAEDLRYQIKHSGVAVVVSLSLFAKSLSEALTQTRPAHAEHPESEPGHAVRRIVFTTYGEYLRGSKGLVFKYWTHWAQGHQVQPAHWKALKPLALHWRHFMRKGRSTCPEPPPAPQDLAVIHYTSGTTGDRPQGVMLSHANLAANALQMRHWIPEARPADERILAALPFAHSYGLTSCLNFAPLVAATLVLLPSFSVPDVLKAVKQHKPTLFPGTPPMYRRLAEYPDVRRFGLASIRVCVSGGSPLPLEVQEAFERVTRGRVIEGYGLTEASPLTHANPLGVRRRPGAIGLPVSDTEAKIVDPELGHSLPDGEVGELWVRGPQVMQGYWQDPAATALALRGEGWLATGDMARRDEEGFFYIVDRKKDLILNGSLCVYPREIEEVIYEHPAVLEAAVAARPAAETALNAALETALSTTALNAAPTSEGQPTPQRSSPGAQLVAFVVLKRDQPLSSADFMRYCADRLPPALMPQQVVFLKELPRNFVGKVLRRQLFEAQ
jgi:long-chain acyl-CoA synthetase